MATTISGLQGKTVYRGSSYAPTRGTNNPTGYLQRELSKQGLVDDGNNNNPNGNVGLHGGVSTVGSDGNSDTRSGLAANALKTTGAVGTSNGQGNALSSGKPQLTVPDAPTAQISSIGEIKLPYNFGSTQNILAEQQAAQEALRNIQQSQQDNAINYVRDVAGTQDSFDTTMLGSRNNASGRGTGFSSAYGKAVSTNYGKFSDLMQQLASDHGTKTLRANQDQNSVLSKFDTFLKSEVNKQGYDAMQNAGTWDIKKKADPVSKTVAASKEEKAKKDAAAAKKRIAAEKAEKAKKAKASKSANFAVGKKK